MVGRQGHGSEQVRLPTAAAYTGCMGELHEACIAALVEWIACRRAMPKRFGSRPGQSLATGFSRRAIYRNNYPDTQNVKAGIINELNYYYI